MTELFTVWQTSGPLQQQQDIQSLQQPQTGHPITSAINEVRTTTTYHGCRAVEQNDLLTRSTEQPEVT